MQCPDNFRARAGHTIVVLVSAIVSAAMAIAALNTTEADGGRPRIAAAFVTPETQPMLLVIGDSFAAGVDSSFEVYPQVLGDLTGMAVRVDGQGATGYHADGSLVVGRASGIATAKAIDRLPADGRRWRPDVILVDLGRNDLGTEPPVVATDIVGYFTALRALWPHQPLVIVVPSYVNDTPPVTYLPMLATLRAVAVRDNAALIDPVAQRWYARPDVNRLRWRDGVHLNAAGNVFYAQKIFENLQRLDLVHRKAMS